MPLGLIKGLGNEILDTSREQQPWTRTRLRVNIQTGEREHYPDEEPLQFVGDPRELLSQSMRIACQAVIDAGLSPEEAAERLGVPEANIRRALKTARERSVIRTLPDGRVAWSNANWSSAVKTSKLEEVYPMDPIKRALELLIDEKKSVAEIAEELGYSLSGIRSIINRSKDRGEIVRLTHGVYGWPGTEEEKPETVAETAPEETPAEKLVELEKRLHALEQTVAMAFQTQTETQEKLLGPFRDGFDHLKEGLESIKNLSKRVEKLESATASTIQIGPVAIQGQVAPYALKEAAAILAQGAFDVDEKG